MRGNILNGAGYLIEGIKLALSKGLKRFILVPLIINTIILSTIIGFTFFKLSSLYTEYTSSFSPWIIAVLGYLLWFIFALASILFTTLVFTMLSNLIASPFYGLLADKTQKKLTRHLDDIDSSIWEVATIAPRAIMRELRKLMHFIPWLLLGLLISIIPFTMMFAPFVWWAILSYIVSIQYTDYSADNQKLTVKDTIKIIKKEPLTMIGFGATLSFALGIPILNLIIPPAAVCGGTSLLLYLKSKPIKG